MNNMENALSPKKSTIFQKKLEENENYLISWSRDFSSEENGSSFDTYLHFPNIADFYEYDIKEEYSVWKTLTFDGIVKSVIRAFLGVSFGIENLANKYISRVDKIVLRCLETNIFSEEYAKGILYLCTLIKIHKNWKFGNADENDYKLLMSCSFDDLPNKGKTMVFLAKQNLQSIIDEKDKLVIMKQIINLDPSNWLWTWLLYLELEKNRKDEDVPSDEQIEAILIAMKLTKCTEYQPVCISNFCRILALILRHRVQNNLPNTTLDVGSTSFGSNEVVVDFIRANASYAFKKQKKYWDAMTIRLYGIILSRILPPEFQDSDLAKNYEKTATRIIHENANGDPENQECLTLHKRIYCDLVYRIPYLLKCYKKNAEKLEANFITIWENEHWSDQEKYSFHFLHGLYFSIKNDVENAIVHWMQMDLARGLNSVLFVDFAYAHQIRMYNNPTESEYISLNLDNVLKVVLARLIQDGLPELEKNKLSALKIKLEAVIKFEEKINQLHGKDLTAKVDEMNLMGENSKVELEDTRCTPEELSACETYFVYWLNSGPAITKETILKMMNNFDKQSGVPHYATEECIKLEFAIYSDYDTSTSLKSIIKFMVEAFLHISFGISDFGAKIISLVDYGITYCVNERFFSEEYGDGLKYLCGLLNVHLNMPVGFAGNYDLSKLSLSSFEVLPAKGKAIVYYAKFVFNKLFPERKNEFTQILQTVINLEPDNWKWPWKLFINLKSLREKNKILLPTEDEIASVSKAVELSVSSYEHSNCVRVLCDTLANIIAFRIRNNLPNTPINFGITVFESNSKAVDFIKLKARECLERQDFRNAMYKVNLIRRYADIFRHTLPFKIQDIEFAKMCDDVCTKLVSDDEERDLVHKIRVETKQNDYRGSLERILQLFENPRKNFEKLDNVFQEIWKKEEYLKDHEIYSLHFLNGCYFVMTGDVKTAIMRWLQMNFQSENEMEFLYLDFTILPRIKNKYRWPDELHFSKVHDEILSMDEEDNITALEKERLTVLKLRIENAINADILYDQKHESDTVAQENLKIKYPGKRRTRGQTKRANYVQREIEKCETYFINWLGDYQMTKKKLKSITESLYEVIPKPDQITEEELKEHFTTHMMLTIQKIIAPLVEAFLNILCGNIDLVVKNISWVEYVTKHCVEEHVLCGEGAKGINYICDLVKIHKNMTLGDSSKIHCREFSSRFEDLSDKGKSMVFVAKWILNESIPHRRLISVEDLKKVVSLDINNWIWNYVLCNRLRFLRRQDSYSGPDHEEIYSIARAVDNSVAMPYYHAMCLSGLCQCLSEIIRHRFHEKLPNTPVNIGTKTFQSEEEVVQYIKATANDAFNSKEFGFPEAIRYGEMFSSLLSHKHRDYELAEKCYKFCFKRNPLNSKLNHRMGILLLTGKEDFWEAIIYFKIALEISPTNFPAWADLIQTLLAHPRQLCFEIERFLKSFWENETGWNENERFSAHFLEGCYLAMTGKIPRAVSLWTKHNSHTPPSEKSTDFPQLGRIAKRHKWPQGAGLNYEALIDEILIRIESASVPDTAKLKLLKVKIENEIYRQNCRFEYGSNAGSTYRGRQYYHHWQSRATVADKVSSWRTSNLPEASNDNDDIVRQPDASSTNSKYVPPHLRGRENQDNTGQNQVSNFWRWR